MTWSKPNRLWCICGVASKVTPQTRVDTHSPRFDTFLVMGIVREITGGQRNRLFAYSQVLQVLSEGTEW